MMMETALPQRSARHARKSAETDISLSLTLDGSGTTDIQTGFGMLDHMLTLTAFWAGMDLHLRCRGDLHIDAHHSAEDIGLVLGQAVLEALGDRVGIARVGYGRVPMDEALSDVTIDLSGRPGWNGAVTSSCPRSSPVRKKTSGGSFTRPLPAAPAATCM